MEESRQKAKEEKRECLFWGLMDEYDSGEIYSHWLTANCSVVVFVGKRNVAVL